jgi:hypothetical protein
MTEQKKEKDIKKNEDAQTEQSNDLNVMRNLSKLIATNGIVLTVFVYTGTHKQASSIIKDVAPAIEPKPTLTMDDLQEMIKDSSVTLNQESANELQRLLDANDTVGLLSKMFSMREFKDKLLQKFASFIKK